MRSDSSDRWQDDVGGMRQIKLKGNMKERCNAKRYGKIWVIHCLFILNADPANITCVSTRISREISTMSQTVLICAKIPKSAFKVISIWTFLMFKLCAMKSTLFISLYYTVCQQLLFLISPKDTSETTLIPESSLETITFMQ